MIIDGYTNGVCKAAGKLVMELERCPICKFDDEGVYCVSCRCDEFERAKPLAEVVYSDEDGEIYDFFDEVETIEDCTVQILRNSKTGKESVGWWRNH